MTLYEIKEQYLQALESLQIDDETGEIIGGEYIANLQSEFAEKAENVGLYIKNLKADVNALGNEIQALTARKRETEKRVEWLRSYLYNVMKETGNNKISTSKISMYFKKSQKLQCNADFVKWCKGNRDDLLRYSEPELDKMKIKEEIKNGAVFDGAWIEQGENIIIR